MSNLSPVRFVAHQRHFKLLNVEDQELPEATGQDVLGFLVAPTTCVGRQDPAHESPAHPTVSTSGFPPVSLHSDVSGLTGAS